MTAVAGSLVVAAATVAAAWSSKITSSIGPIDNRSPHRSLASSNTLLFSRVLAEEIRRPQQNVADALKRSNQVAQVAPPAK